MSLNLGIIGTGRIGRIHIKNLQQNIPGVCVSAVTDVNTSAANEVAKEFGIENVANSYKEILSDSSVDGVVICSSTDTHLEIIQESVKSKKAIFCEKPIDLNIEKVRSAVKGILESKIIFQLGFNRRFDPNFSEVANEVYNGRLGKAHIVKITSRDPGPPPIEYVKSSGGLFMDMTIHDFDMAYFLVKKEIKEVFAMAGNFIDSNIKEAGDVDTACTMLKYEDGSMCIIDNSRKATYGYDQRVEVHGDKGCLLAENIKKDSSQFWGENGLESAKPMHFFLERYQDAYIHEMKEFVSCLTENRNPCVGARDGLRAALVADAALKSYKQNAPVQIYLEI